MELIKLSIQELLYGEEHFRDIVINPEHLVSIVDTYEKTSSGRKTSEVTLSTGEKYTVASDGESIIKLIFEKRRNKKC